MTFPQSKPASRLWWANDPTERDSIGSNDGLDVGDVVFQLDDNTWYRCTAVTGGDTSTWVVGGAVSSWAGTLTVGGGVSGGTSPTISDGDVLQWSDGTFNRLVIARSGDNIVLQMRDGAGDLQGTIDLDTVTAEVRFPADVTLDSAGAVLGIGNAAGAPQLILDADTLSEASFLFQADSVTQFGWHLEADDDFVLRNATPATVLKFRDGETLEAEFAGRVGVSGGDPDDASVLADDLVIGSGGADAGATVFNTSSGYYAFTDVSGTFRGFTRYRHSLDRLEFGRSGVEVLRMTGTVFDPATTNTVDFGTDGQRFKDLYLSGECFAGSYNQKTRAVTDADSPVTWAVTNGFLELDATSGVITANMPAISDGKNLHAYVLNATSAITFDGSGTETINGSTTKVVSGGSAIGLYVFIARTASDWLMVGPITLAP